MSLFTTEKLRFIRQLQLATLARWIMAFAGIIRVLEITVYAFWTQSVVPWGLPGSSGSWHLSPIHGPDWWFLTAASLGFLSYLVWAMKGGHWGVLPLVLGPLVNQEHLPIGWGLLAIQPYVLWDIFLGSLPKLRRPRLITWLLIFQVVWIYLSSVTGKDMNYWWHNANALEQGLSGELMATSAATWLREAFSASWLQFFTRSVMLFQFSVILLIPFALLGRWGYRLSVVWSLAMIGFHITTGIFFHLNAFAIACCVMVILPFRSIEASPAPEWRRNLFLSLSGVLLLTGFTLGALRSQSLPAWRWGLVQSWGVMKRPEMQGHMVIDIPSRQWSTEQLEHKWKYALAWKLFLDQKAFFRWLRPACEANQDKIRWEIWHTQYRKKFIGELSCR